MTRPIALSVIFILLTSAAFGQNWQSGCVDGGALWPNRVSVTIENGGDSALERFLPLPIGDGKNQLPLVGERVESIRLFGPDGKELLYDMETADGVALHSGATCDGAMLTIPVAVEAKSSAVYTIYYGNPKSGRLPDGLNTRMTLANGDFETVIGNVFAGWQFDAGDEKHTVAVGGESPFSGKKCVKTVVASGAEPTWIAARQVGVSVEAGARYRFTAAVKGENIVGRSGWYLHIGSASKPMMAAPMADAGEGSFDWKTVTLEFTAPPESDRVEFGTVLRGTGTAWYDAARLEQIDEAPTAVYTITVGAPENMPYKIVAPEGFDFANPNDFDLSKAGFDKNARFALLRVLSNGEARTTNVLFDAALLERRLGPNRSVDSLTLLTPSGEKRDLRRWNDLLLFEAETEADTAAYYLAVETDEKTNSETADKKESALVADGAFPGTLEQTIAANDSQTSGEAVPELLRGGNLVKNGSFDIGGEWPDDWDANAPEGVTIRRTDGGSVEMTVAPEAAQKWPGLRQSVPVRGGATYFVSYRVQNVAKSAPYRLHYHQYGADGKLSSGGIAALAETANIDGWQSCGQMIRVANDTTNFILHLTVNTAGTYRFDDFAMVEAESSAVLGVYAGKSGVFQVPSVVKVFPETTFTTNDSPISAENPAKIFAVRGETEPLQIAFRSEKSGTYRVSISAPKNADGGALATPTAEAVGLVPVDCPTNYYHYPDKKTYERKYPTGGTGSDGWAGEWPDPLIPIRANENAPKFDEAKIYDSDSARLAAAGADEQFELSARRTRALWLTFDVPTETKAGEYTGSITLENIHDGQTILVPYLLRVFDVALGKLPASGAIYDLRSFEKFASKGESTADVRTRLVEFMAQRKLSPDTLPACPQIVYDKATGETTCDWTEFDKAAHWYFDELSVRWSYTPGGLFYCFGWGLPPKSVEDEPPYEGTYPFAEADHAVLRPEYKKAYQARLRCFWNHVKEKGWANRFVLYISDEPFYTRPEIIAQMQALCAMIHEVDPSIKIYSSTWRHVSEWDGSLDVWGIGHYGIVPVEQLEKSRSRGDSFWWTTDGQMCLDTPYCAVERLLPWWCWRYGADAYEFWGANWYTYDPFEFGWHSYIPQSDTPTNKYFVRYPDGDGYIIYPGNFVGLEGEIISSVRAEAARDGQEDGQLLTLLDEAIKKAPTDSAALARAKELRDEAASFVPIPVASGRYSTQFLTNPSRIETLKADIGAVLEQLSGDKLTAVR